MTTSMPLSPAAAPAASGSLLWAQDDRHSWLIAGLVWLLLVLMIVPDGMDYAALLGNAPASGSPGSRLLWMGLLGAGVVIAIWRSGLTLLLLRRLNPFMLLFVCLVGASVAWSIEPAFTVRRLIRLATILLVAIGFVLVGWHERRFQNVLRPLLTLLLLGSIPFALLNPALGVHHEIESGVAGSWRGLANHKNTLGMLAGTSVILWVHAGLLRSVRVGTLLFGLAVSGICLIKSRSSTSIMSALMMLPLLYFLISTPRALRPYMPVIIAGIALILMVYAVAVLRLVPGLEALLQPIVMLTGKDLTFTGRSEIWAIVSEQVQLHPWLGGGYGAYWTGPVPTSPSYQFLGRMFFYPGSAHNGYLDIVNDLGAIGLVCLLGYLATYVMQALKLLIADRAQGALYLTLFLQQALTNFSESLWFNVLSVGFGIMALVTTAMARSLLEQNLRQYFGSPIDTAPPSPSNTPIGVPA